MKRTAILLAMLPLAACETSGDPADGGFVSGIAGVAGGVYDARIDEREGALAQEQARGASLNDELTRLTGDLDALKLRIIQQRSDLRLQGVRLTPQSEQAVQAVISNSPLQRDPNARLAALSKAVADARALSESLAELAS